MLILDEELICSFDILTDIEKQKKNFGSDVTLIINIRS